MKHRREVRNPSETSEIPILKARALRETLLKALREAPLKPLTNVRAQATPRRRADRQLPAVRLRWCGAVAAALCCIVLAGCGGAASSPANDNAAGGEPSEQAILRVGTSFDYPPFSLPPAPGGADPSGAGAEPQGFSADLARALAEDLGFEVRFVDFDWPELSRDVAAGRFDVAISGITWRPERAAIGAMSRALAAGGPCTVSSSELGAAPELAAVQRPPSTSNATARVAVNRGGILERWARAQWREDQIVTVDDNLQLPELLRRGEADLFVTDRFEAAHFAEAGQHVHCQPPADRKVVWIAPAALHLVEPIDRWIEQNEPALQELRRQHFGDPMPRDAADHLVDLLARRLAFMPAVALDKQRRGIELVDVEREKLVVDEAVASARTAGLVAAHDREAVAVRHLFELQIELAKQLQRQTLQASTDIPSGGRESALTLEQIRPALLGLGDDLVAALAATSSHDLRELSTSADRLAPLTTWLESGDVARLIAACVAVLESVEEGRKAA